MTASKLTLFTLISVVLILAVCELTAKLVLVQIGAPEYVYHADYMNGYKYDPYIAFRSTKFPMYGSRHSSDRSAIYITGGSTAAGVGVDFRDSYFRLLEEHLIESKLIEHHQLVNFAVPGFVSSQESGVYKNWIFNVPQPPRFLISFTGFNDAYFYLFRTLPAGSHEFSYAIDLVFRKGYPPPSAKVDQFKNYIRQTNLFALQHRLLEPAGQAIRLASDIFDPQQPKQAPTDQAVINEAAQNFLDNCKATGLLAKYQGTKFIVLLQPIYFYGGELFQGPNRMIPEYSALQRWVNDVSHQKAAYDGFFKIVLAGLEDLKRRGILDYWDYRDKLKSAGPVYLDPVHFNEKGSLYIAEAMYKDLQKEIKGRSAIK